MFGHSQKKMGVAKLPDDICNRETLPFMSRDVQRACATFPMGAERALRSVNMSPSEFYYVLDNKYKKDMWFRRKAEAIIKRLKKEGNDPIIGGK